MSELGPSLQSLIINSPTVINEAAIYFLITQIINRVETLHELGFRHGNICPSSLYLDINNHKQILLADFNHSQKFQDVSHLQILRTTCNIAPFSGDLAFASLSTLKNKVPTMKDDIISIIYLMIFLTNGYTLPWPTSNSQGDSLKDIQKHIKIRETEEVQSWLRKSMPKELQNFYEKAEKWKNNNRYDEPDPDYHGLRAIIFQL